MDQSPQGSSVHGILLARVLERVVMPFSRGSSRPGEWTQAPCFAGKFFTVWATRYPDLNKEKDNDAYETTENIIIKIKKLLKI